MNASTPHLVRDTSVLGGRAISLWTRNPASVIGAVVFPLVFFVMFNLVARKMMTARGFDYAQLLPATIVVQAMFFTGMSSAYYVAADRLSGMTGRLQSMPIHRAAPLVARSVGDVSRAVISVLVLLVASVAAGLRFQVGLAGIAGFVVVSLVFAAVVSLGMGMIGMRAQTPETASSLASIPYLPLVMLSSGFAPVEDFPGWMQSAVANQPVTRTIDLLRALADGGPTAVPFAWWMGWMVLLVAAFIVLAVRVSSTSAP